MTCILSSLGKALVYLTIRLLVRPAVQLLAKLLWASCMSGPGMHVGLLETRMREFSPSLLQSLGEHWKSQLSRGLQYYFSESISGGKGS
jgi:hypothetical protein